MGGSISVESIEGYLVSRFKILKIKCNRFQSLKMIILKLILMRMKSNHLKHMKSLRDSRIILSKVLDYVK
jgi:hypothetical protein